VHHTTIHKEKSNNTQQCIKFYYSIFIWSSTYFGLCFRLMMMGGVSPETCWASYKYGIIKFDTLLHLVRFFFMNCTSWDSSEASTSVFFSFIRYLKTRFIYLVTLNLIIHAPWS
jgi:heme/copper-type cytochrome/quinol oxidase subunit 4